jgi:hypothetical protein
VFVACSLPFIALVSCGVAAGLFVFAPQAANTQISIANTSHEMIILPGLCSALSIKLLLDENDYYY